MGYVYILVNDSMPDLIKIGRTARKSSTRAKDLSNSTGIPTPFKVAFELSSEEYIRLESEMHSKLAEDRVASNREFFRCSVGKAKELLKELYSKSRERLALNKHPINQKAKFLLTQVPENSNDFYQIPSMAWKRPLTGTGSKDRLYLLDLMMWYLENHSNEIMEDTAYIGLNDRDLEIQISELHHLPSEQVMKWMEIPKGVFSDDELGCGELEDRFLIETDPKTGGWLAIQHLLTIMEAQQIKFQLELEIKPDLLR